VPFILGNGELTITSEGFDFLKISRRFLVEVVNYSGCRFETRIPQLLFQGFHKNT
jgi:hypothetical protein